MTEEDYHYPIVPLGWSASLCKPRLYASFEFNNRVGFGCGKILVEAMEFTIHGISATGDWDYRITHIVKSGVSLSRCISSNKV